MGKNSILIKLERKGIIDSFSKIKEVCEEFYKKCYDPKHEDVNSMEIRGRLDFINEEQVKKIAESMNKYKEKVSLRDIEAICFDYQNSFPMANNLENALIEVAMYGQMTFVNQGLFDAIQNKLIQSYNFPSLTMAYVSYSILMRGSESSLNFNPFLLVEVDQGHTNITIDHDAKQPFIQLGPREKIQPKPNKEEYFSFGKHPCL
jgi:hypothetical protein